MIKIVLKKVDDLIEMEGNPRQLTEAQYSDLSASLEKFGIVEPVIVNSCKGRENRIIGGHQRVRVLKDMGHREIPCVEISLTEEEERELNIRLNANTGEWDKDELLNQFEMDELKAWSSLFDGNFFDINMDKYEEEEGKQGGKAPKVCPECGHEF